MIQKLFIVLLSTVLLLSITVIVVAHCGSSWEFAQPTFSPELNAFGCLHAPNGVVANNPTATTKTVG